MGVSYFFLNSFAGRQAGRQAGSLSCLALSSCDCMCDEPSHGEGGEAAEANVSFFFLGGRTGQGGESSYQFIYTHTHAHARAGRVGKNKKR